MPLFAPRMLYLPTAAPAVAAGGVVPIRTPWGQQKPPLGTQVNTGHPLARGLIGAWILNEGGGFTAYNIAGTQNVTLNSLMGWENVLQGTAVKQITAGSGGSPCLTSGTFPSFNGMYCTLVSEGYNFSANGNFATLSANQSIAKNGSNFALWKEGAGGPWATMSASPVAGYNFVAASVNTNAAGSLFYFNGAFYTVTAGGGGTPPTASTSIKTGTLVNSLPNAITLTKLLLYNRPLSAGEIQQLYVAPFCFMQPRTLWLPTGAGTAPSPQSMYSLFFGGGY